MPQIPFAQTFGGSHNRKMVQAGWQGAPFHRAWGTDKLDSNRRTWKPVEKFQFVLNLVNKEKLDSIFQL